MKALVAIAFVSVLMGTAHAQQQPPAAPAAQQQAPVGQAICMSQHVEAPGVSAAALITRGYDIKAAVPGGLWVQKDREVYFCNSGRALDNDVLCWRLREPVKGQVCQ
ncbi:hypothetical protein SAMN02990966_01331 [Rhodospirillales bacterium URHD0017]|nr:hypothetical protein SAMN02990966_01331 [Rhodospirillales bacterium URHD0017]